MKRILPSLPRAALRPVLGIAAVAATIAGAAALGLLEPVSLSITFGGTLAVACATFSRRRLEAAWRQVADALRASGEDDDAASEATIAAFKRLARIQRIDGPPALERAARRETDPFLRAAVERVLEWSDGAELREALLGEARRFAAAGEDARAVLLTLGKLFPAFGLIGTLLGLALMLPAASGGDVTAVAPGLGVAVLTTLYGAVLANAVVLPLATKLQTALARRSLVLQMIVLGAELLHRREYPTRIERALRSFAGLAPLAPAPPVTELRDRAA